MDARDLPDLLTLAAVARRRSFARAAAELGVSRSAVSHALRGLEERIGTRLLNRTTRSVAPTAAGERLLAEVAPALARIAGAVEEASLAAGRPPSGRLRLNVPRLGAVLLAGRALAGFAAAFPAIQVELAVEDALVDIVAGGFDAGIRFGAHVARDMISVAIGPPIAFAIVASPAYVARHGAPRAPAELARHACIGFRFRGSGVLYAWELRRRGKITRHEVTGPLVVDHPETVVHAALAGVGLGYVAAADAEPLLAAGRLVAVLPEWCEPVGRLHLYHPSRRQVPPPLRAFVDWLRVFRWS